MSLINEDVLLFVVTGPPLDEPKHDYMINHGNVMNRYNDAIVGHYPSVDWVSHLIVWTRNSVHIFDYHEVDSCFKVDANGKMIKP